VGAISKAEAAGAAAALGDDCCWGLEGLVEEQGGGEEQQPSWL
jgi:hypothetical protein